MLELEDKPFGIDHILELSNGVPDDLADWNLFWEKAHETIRKAERDNLPVPEVKSFKYPGAKRYTIKLDRDELIIVARRRKNGTYEIQSVTGMYP